MIELILQNKELILKLILLTWFISENDYIEAFLNNLVEKKENVLTYAIYDIVTCFYCLSFWSGLVVFLMSNSFENAFYLSLSVSFTAWIVKKLLK